MTNTKASFTQHGLTAARRRCRAAAVPWTKMLCFHTARLLLDDAASYSLTSVSIWCTLSIFKHIGSAMDARRKRILLTCLLWNHHRKKSQKTRKYWIHPLLEKRHLTGEFVTLFHDLRENSSKFFNYFRMSVASFDELCAKLQEDLQKEDTKIRNCIPPVEMLAVTLR